MTFEELISKAKEDQNLEMYETLTGYKGDRDKEVDEQKTEIEKLKTEGEAKDTEIQKLKDKTWELLESGAHIYSEQRKAKEEQKPLSASDIVKGWKK